MKKLSGETRLLLIMGLIVLAGGGYLAFSQSGIPLPIPGGASPTPNEPTPIPLNAEKVEKLLADSKHRKGPKDSSKPDLAIVEFGDVECSSCRYAYQKLTKGFGETISVEFAFHHFPLPNHEYAMPCAQALEAADRQGKFWPMYAAMFEEENPELDVNYIQATAKKVGLDMDRFVKDTQDPETRKLVEQDAKGAQDMMIMRTPTFYILDRKKGTVDVAIGGRTLLEKLQGIPGVPTPEPVKK